MLLLALLLMAGLAATSQPAAAAPADLPRPAVSVFVDTDTGVDDAVALALLLRTRTVNLVGISTVAGNTSTDNAAKNVLTILDAAQRSVPVTVGAPAPLAFPASHVGMFAHGPDGLWFAQRPHDISGLPHDAPAAIAAAARANPNLTLLAIGPLTNVAQAVQRYPQDMANVSIVALAGAQVGGNRSPIAETNAFNDPQALGIVLNARLKLTLITLDAFKQVTVDSVDFPKLLAASPDPLAQFLAQPLAAYGAALTSNAGGPVEIPDAVAALYVTMPSIAAPQSALVKVSTDAGLTRGQTVIATAPNLTVEMIAGDAELSALADGVFSGQVDPNAAIGAILAREPDNARVVLALRNHRDGNWLRDGLLGR
jgi:inosine-uridine nucleoside N-ribohydrolase